MLSPTAKRLEAPRRTAMNTLKISDLTVTEELDRDTMRAVHGGFTAGSLMSLLPSLGQLKFGNGATIGGPQQINQGMNIENYNGMDTAFDTGVTSIITPHQSANNSITLI
jgi:hypothetical protein